MKSGTEGSETKVNFLQTMSKLDQSNKETQIKQMWRSASANNPALLPSWFFSSSAFQNWVLLGREQSLGGGYLPGCLHGRRASTEHPHCSYPQQP